MAANLLKAGFDLTVTAHRSRAAVERLVALGAHEAPTRAALAAQVEVVVTCVSDDAAVEQVLLGPEGIADGAHEGLIVVDTSTISPLTSQRLSAEVAQRGITLLDAPISGGQGGAIAGTLAIMVGGDQAAFDTVLPVLEAMGSAITYVGPSGSALVVKLCNNLIVAAIMAASSEAITMAAKAGVDTGLVHQVLSKSTCRGFIVEQRLASSVLAGNLTPGFKLSLMRKDMGLALSYGNAVGVPMFTTGLVHQLYTQALGLGKGDLDSYAIAQLYAEAVGVDLRSNAAKG
jgi:3-hydroxyisobutyrate dehydrogenase-like beta-hydroxyacid dehydrogenase